MENDEKQKQNSEGWEITKEFIASLQKFSSQEEIKQMTELNAELSQIPGLGPWKSKPVILCSSKLLIKK